MSQGTEANNFNAVYGAWSWLTIVEPSKALEFAGRYSQRRIASAPEGSPLDRSVPSSCEIAA